MNPRVVDWLGHVLPHFVASAIAPTWFTMVALAGLVSLVWMLAVARRHGIASPGSAGARSTAEGRCAGSIDRGAIASIVLWVLRRRRSPRAS